MAYLHSVKLDLAKCNGCTTCMRHCPTEAIRIHNRHAYINSDRCIDCGECIKVCPRKAKGTESSSLDKMKNYRYNVALPSPALYGQFENLEDVDYILNGLLKMGFDDVYEVAAAAEIVSAYTRVYLQTENIKKPVISSSCPAVLRLIGLRYPSLNDNIMHILPPSEIAAGIAKKKVMEHYPDLSEDEIGICYISPCPAKASYVRNGFGNYKSQIDYVVPIREIYFELINKIKPSDDVEAVSHSGMIGIGWATSGGEASALFNDQYLSADGIDNVIRVLDQIENGNIPKVEFIELNACIGGCVGGAMNIQNPFIAKSKLQGLRRYLPVSQNFIKDRKEQYIPSEMLFDSFPEYHPISQLSDSFAESMRMLSDIGKLRSKLPGIDCGACGAPNCRAFAEDCVKGDANEDDCVIRYRSLVSQYLKRRQ